MVTGQLMTECGR